MFLDPMTFDSFGELLKNARKSNRLTQLDVYELTGVNRDTLRKLESNQSIPKYDTLERLSIVYKLDLVELFSLSRSNTSFNGIYKLLDDMICNNDFNNIDDIDELIDNYKEKDITANKDDVQQLRLFKAIIKDLYTLEEPNYEELIENCYEILRLSNENFDESRLLEYKYNHFEIRILLIISVCQLRLDNGKEATKILKKAESGYINIESQPIWNKKVYIKILSNLSYSHYLIEDYNSSLKYANKAIDYTTSNDMLYMLYMPLAMKSLSIYKLGLDGYIDFAKKSILVLELVGNIELITEYKRIFKKNYNIEI